MRLNFIARQDGVRRAVVTAGNISISSAELANLLCTGALDPQYQLDTTRVYAMREALGHAAKHLLRTFGTRGTTTSWTAGLDPATVLRYSTWAQTQILARFPELDDQTLRDWLAATAPAD